MLGFVYRFFLLNATLSLCVSLPPQYFEYTSQKEIRFNTVTELCAEVLEGKVSVGMRHCPGDNENRPASILWEFRQVHLPFIRRERLGRLGSRSDLCSII